jgi:hypothetical protein
VADAVEFAFWQRSAPRHAAATVRLDKVEVLATHISNVNSQNGNGNVASMFGRRHF